MTSLNIKNTKNFMNTLLVTEQFDSFSVEEVNITTFNTFHIDGRIEQEFFDLEEREALPVFSIWKDIRPICFQLIKGKKTPVSFKVVLHASPELLARLSSDYNCTITANLIHSLVLNIRYDNGKVSCITASSLTTFIPDKSIDNIWDTYIKKLFSKLQIDYE